MLYSILFYLKFWIFLILAMPAIIPLWILKLFGLKESEKRFVLWATRYWARFVLRIMRADVTVFGIENIPEGGNIVLIANHQGATDIPLVMAVVPKNIGFVAKKELRFLPLISSWMKAMRCVFIDRSSPRKAKKSLDRAVENLKAGHSMVIFPEGTRSRGPKMGTFHHGSFKLAFRAESTIVPITIKGSYKLREEHNQITPGSVELHIHPPISTQGLSAEERREVSSKVAEQIASAL